jgi:chemotaxis response regulator CheB
VIECKERNIDIVIVEVSMPEMDGFKLVQDVFLRPEIPVICKSELFLQNRNDHSLDHMEGTGIFRFLAVMGSNIQGDTTKKALSLVLVEIFPKLHSFLPRVGNFP